MKIVRFGVYSTTTRELLHTFDVDDDGKITNPRAFDEEVWLLPVVKYDWGTQFGKYIQVRKGDQLESFRDGILVESDPVDDDLVPTDQLVHRLRQCGGEYRDQAADRIEHLEAALRDIARETDNDEITWMASKALEGGVS